MLSPTASSVVSGHTLIPTQGQGPCATGTCSGWGERRDGVPRLVRVMGGDILSLGNHRLDFLLHDSSDDAQLPPKPEVQNKG